MLHNAFQNDGYQLFRVESGEYDLSHITIEGLTKNFLPEYDRFTGHKLGNELLVSAHPLENVTSLVNDILEGRLDSGREVIIKLGNPNWEKQKTETEVAALRCLSEYSLVPVPKIYEFCNNSKNSPVGREYIILEKKEGVSLDKLHNELRKDQEGWHRILAELAFCVAEFRKLRFPVIGSFGIAPTGITILGRTEFGNQCEPYTDFQAFAKAAINFYQDKLIKRIAVNDINSPIFLKTLSHIIRIPEAAINALSNDGGICFVHQDFVMKNILIHKGGVNAILDFEWAGAAPYETEGITGFDFLQTDDDREHFERCLMNLSGAGRVPPDEKRAQFYSLLSALYELLTVEDWKNGKVSMTARYLEEKLAQKQVRASPEFDIDAFRHECLKRIKTAIKELC